MYKSVFLVASSLTISVVSAFSLNALGQNPPPSADKGKPVKIGTAYVAPPPGLVEFNQAMAATRAGKYAEAEKMYRALLKKQPDAAAAWANLALLQGRRGAFAEAANSMGKAAQKSPTTPEFWAQGSSFLLRAGKPNEAERAARKALSLPNEFRNPVALANLGDILFTQKRFAEAVPVFRTLRSIETNGGKNSTARTEISLILSLASSGKPVEALTMARQRAQRLPNDANSQLLHGDAARLAGKNDEARTAYQRATTLDPKNPNAKAALAYLAAQRGDRNETLKIVRQNLQKTPDDPKLHFQLGFLYYGDERLTEDERFGRAYQEFSRAATLDPKNPLYVTYTGVALMMGKPDEDRWKRAAILFNGALKLDPKYSLARRGLANMAERTKKFPEAEAQYKAILAYAPKDAAARRGLAGVYYAAGKKADAYREMETLAVQNLTDITFLSELASWQVADGAAADANMTYDRILQRNPNAVAALMAQAHLFENAAQPEEAKKKYAAVLQRDPKNANAALLLGQILDAQKKPDEAIAVYRKLLDADSNSNSVRWQLALALRDQKRYDEALAEMQAITLVKTDPDRVMYLLGAPRLLMERKMYAEAAAELRRLNRENPGEKEILYTLADAQEKAGQTEQAEKTLQEVAALMAKSSPENDPAVTGINQATGLPPRDVRPLTAKAGLDERLGKTEEAATAYEEALRLDPTNIEAIQGLSRTREKLGKPEMAAAFAESLVLEDAKKPSLPALGAARQLHLQTKTTAEFIAFTKRLIEKYPDDRDALYARARILTDETADYKPAAAARTEAISLYDKILKKDANDKNAQTQRAALLQK